MSSGIIPIFSYHKEHKGLHKGRKVLYVKNIFFVSFVHTLCSLW